MIPPERISEPATILGRCMDRKDRLPMYLAFDLGAESGRAMLGCLEGERLQFKEIHRFPNHPVEAGGTLHWDILRLWEEIKYGLELAIRETGGQLTSVGIDTWGVDFALLDAEDGLLGNPVCYRDPRTDGMVEATDSIIPLEDIFQQTGNQIMPINSLFQLTALAKKNSSQLAAARTFLNIPDLFNFWLCGEKASEFTIATTTQCFDPREMEWAWDMLEKLGIHSDIFETIVFPGTILGNIRKDVCREIDTSRIRVIAVGSHDTQSAILAVPAEDLDYLYLSSGTWSLMGTEVDEPIINTDTWKKNLTNEGGIGGKFCLLKNITGLWILQECRRQWLDAGVEYSYDDLTRMAGETEAFRTCINPSDITFFTPGKMVNRIQDYCRKSGQPVPETPGEITRCILESLAMEYRTVASQISEVTGRIYPIIHIIGGGSQNELLNQLTANATGCRVDSGPGEATAAGNILVQAMAVGEVQSISEARRVVRRSFDLKTYMPEKKIEFDNLYKRFLALRNH